MGESERKTVRVGVAKKYGMFGFLPTAGWLWVLVAITIPVVETVWFKTREPGI